MSTYSWTTSDLPLSGARGVIGSDRTSRNDAGAPICITDEDPDLWLYRERTAALLKRYLRISIEVGRLPSILGRELFRSKVTSYRMSSFEDAVIFVHDVERILDRLDVFSRSVIGAVLFQEYTQEEAAAELGCARRTICRALPEALDLVSEMFLLGGLLNRLPPVTSEKPCQEAYAGDFGATDCKQEE